MKICLRAHAAKSPPGAHSTQVAEHTRVALPAHRAWLTTKASEPAHLRSRRARIELSNSNSFCYFLCLRYISYRFGTGLVGTGAIGADVTSDATAPPARRPGRHRERHAYWRGNEPARQGGLVGWQGLLEAEMTEKFVPPTSALIRDWRGRGRVGAERGRNTNLRKSLKNLPL